MDFINVKQAAINWKTSERSVRNYCKQGRVPNAILKGKTWYIPKDSIKPVRKNKKIISNPILSYLVKEMESKLKGGLYHRTQIDFAYNSNRIEGNQLTHEQTRYIFETHTIGLIKSQTAKVDDIVETLNHFKCFNYLLRTIDKSLNENIIKHFHKLLKSNTTDEEKDWFKVGEYKIMPNYVSDIKTSLPENVKNDMCDLLKWYESLKNISINEIIEFHVRFEKIHPFQDGNGRIGRLIMFRECLKHNIVPFVITDDVRLFYYRGLKEWNKQKGYLVDTCLKCQDDYKAILKYLRIKY